MKKRMRLFQRSNKKNTNKQTFIRRRAYKMGRIGEDNIKKELNVEGIKFK